MIISIGGLAGTGTSTTAKVLSEISGVPYISAGDIFRQMAKESELDILEFSKLAENNKDIDTEIDKRQAKLAKESENLIIEGRLSAHFSDADIKVWMITPFDVRAKRICQRESKTIDLVKNEIKIREASEALRYKKIHNIDINDLTVYDIIINTHRFNPTDIAKIILNLKELKEGSIKN